MSIEIPNKAEIKEAVDQIVVELDQIASHREQINEILAMLKERYEVKPALIRKVAQAIHSGKTGEVKTESEELAELTEALAG